MVVSSFKIAEARGVFTGMTLDGLPRAVVFDVIGAIGSIIHNNTRRTVDIITRKTTSSAKL